MAGCPVRWHPTCTHHIPGPIRCIFCNVFLSAFFLYLLCNLSLVCHSRSQLFFKTLMLEKSQTWGSTPQSTSQISCWIPSHGKVRVLGLWWSCHRPGRFHVGVPLGHPKGLGMGATEPCCPPAAPRHSAPTKSSNGMSNSLCFFVKILIAVQTYANLLNAFEMGMSLSLSLEF